MRLSTLRQYIGRVVVLDLVMGREITTRIQSVLDDGYVLCGKPRVFVPMANPNNPNDVQVMCMEYGRPLYRADDTLEISADHVFTVFIPTDEQITEYGRQTSSIISSGGLDIEALRDIDLTKPLG